eukprot:638806-Rhodomonas_salina.1
MSGTGIADNGPRRAVAGTEIRVYCAISGSEVAYGCHRACMGSTKPLPLLSLLYSLPPLSLSPSFLLAPPLSVLYSPLLH